MLDKDIPLRAVKAQLPRRRHLPQTPAITKNKMKVCKQCERDYVLITSERCSGEVVDLGEVS